MVTKELVLSCLLNRPMSLEEMTMAVLKKVVKIEYWEEIAWMRGWSPPGEWFTEERNQIAYYVRQLINTNSEVVVTADFKLRKINNV